MGVESLESAIQRVGSPVELLRNSTYRPMTFPVAPEFTNWRSEQQSWRSSCALLDQSHHMTDLYISGTDALRLLSDFGVNTFKNFTAGKAKQYVAVNQDGHFIGDAILFALEDDLFDVVGHKTVINWLQYNAEKGDYDVTLERDENSYDRPSGPPKLYRYELQGPTAKSLVEKLTGEPLPDIKFFNMTEFTIAGHRVRALRHGMAGQPGFELFGPWAEGEDVLAAILEVGKEFDLVRAGAKAYSTANLESGWIPTAVPAIFGPEMADYREWLGADALGSLGGSMDSAEITDYYVTPYDIGYGRTVKFDHDFLGREALEKIAENAERTKVTLVWNSEDVAAAMRSLFEAGTPAKYLELPKSRYAFFQVDKVVRNGEQVGMSLDLGYIVNEQEFVSLATVDKALAEPGTKVSVVWGEQPVSAKPAVERHRQVEIRATVAPAPYVYEVRDNYRKS
ncbi:MULTISPECIES: aminomethyl transferase family protein [unclassified Rhodococcus (in: high G+C Gram-positive bacteria)]|uniref:aminomethyl transferase family protein n=1 Tax=unclassified Rhodococcus (in: high G+C Gram-positive bacteria) TaxID=192944 RepID=UPI001639FE3F|nr:MULTISPECIES: aminomethyl transferase family protein [unclassified Rhodococcus (in: high G+C Gram-positive bacteria)]MBC2644705.1 aminomethyl transferase family protein [Rhodococcus sp. 3A]MBC2898304.1 aminomethyl transferase family protein [Rhodococcus sp. 4CII]